MLCGGEYRVKIRGMWRYFSCMEVFKVFWKLWYKVIQNGSLIHHLAASHT